MKPLDQWSSADIIEFAKSVDKKTWLMIASGAVVSILVLVFFIIPAWIERPLLRRDIESMEGQVRQVNALSQKRIFWEQDEKAFGDLIRKTQARLFTEEDLSVLLGQISKMGSESRIEVLASKPTAEKNLFQTPYNSRYQPSGYEFTLQGGFHNLADLASRIESHEKLLRIRGFQIVPSEKSPNQHVAELKLWAILKAAPAAVSSEGAVHAKK